MVYLSNPSELYKNLLVVSTPYFHAFEKHNREKHNTVQCSTYKYTVFLTYIYIYVPGFYLENQIFLYILLLSNLLQCLIHVFDYF